MIVYEKLESLRRCIERIEQRRLTSAEALIADVDTQDILTLNLTRAVQLCVDVAVSLLSNMSHPAPATMGEAFLGLSEQGVIDEELAQRLRAAVGFRNLAVHAYDKIDWGIVHRLSYEGLDDLKAFSRQVASAASGGADN